MRWASLKSCSSLLFLFSTSFCYGEDSDNKKQLLQLSLADLLKIQVSTASKSDQPISDAPSIINVISEKEISDLGLKTLADALKLMPGFTPIQQLMGEKLLVVRGLALKDGVLILIDGVPVNDVFDGSFDFYKRPLDDIEKIEVMRGPGSALYGSYAVSAIIQLFTKRYQQDNLNLKVGAGSFSEQRYVLNLSDTISINNTDAKIAASFSYFDNQGDKLFIAQDSIFSPELGTFLPPLSNPTLTPTQRQESTEKFNGHFNVELADFDLTFVHSQIISHPLVSHLGIVTDREATIKESTQDALALKHHWHFSENTQFQTKVYWVLNESKLFGQSQPPQFRGDEDQDGLNENFPSGIIENFHHKTLSKGVNFEIDLALNEAHQILIGIEYDDTNLEDVNKVANVSLAGRGPTEVFPAQDMTFEFMPTGVERDFTALYLQDRWQVNKRTSITTGIRYGDYSDFGDTTNPRLAVVHQFNSKTYTKVLFGEAFRAPAFAQLFDLTPTLSSNRFRGNSQLMPTEIKTYEWQVGHKFSETLISSATLFKNDTSNEIFFNATPGIQQWQNSGQRTSNGIEIELQGQFFDFDYTSLNYSFQDTSGVAQGAGANIHSPHRLNFFANKKLNERLNMGVSLSYFSSPKREQNDSRSRIDEKTLANLNLKYNDVFTRGLNLEFLVSNLFDEDGRDEIENSIGLLDDIPIEGRKYQFTVSYQIR